MTADPAAHQAHEFPLADRIVDQAIRDWLETRFAVARAAAGAGALSDRERAVHAGIDDMECRLSGYGCTLTPAILDALRRAGLLARQGASDARGSRP
jgi:hypothetical protein